MRLVKFLGLAGLAIQLLAQPASAETLTVAVAANVKYAFNDLARQFRQETGIAVQGVFASAGKIASQVKSGAPFDVFLSADTEFPELLYEEGFAASKPRVYAYGVLVLWSTTGVALDKGLAVLADPAVRKIAIPNPKLAPYGRAAMQALDALKLRAAVEPKLVYGESITQATQYIDSAAVDVGFTAKSVVLAPELMGKGKWVTVPAETHMPIAQAMVVLKHGAQSQGARAFAEFIFSRQARAIFEKYGYLLP